MEILFKIQYVEVLMEWFAWRTVRRQGIWNRSLLDIAESLAHLLFDIRRLDCGIANAVD